MLILKLRPGESLTIGPNITVTVCRLQYGSVRLGITAPRDVPVWREELIPPPAGRGEPVGPLGSRPGGGLE